ncbi:MAG: protein-tyrosine-phosphatase [Bacteroidetes bacterium HGW-Bacteroidetes-2]|jgi:arsenate reductase|nr:MAG: protein-tyrosine-phosphatase [Bacteroidetes bacterium HGW-Bacteroidetes-2]
MATIQNSLFIKISETLQSLDLKTISEDRKKILQPLIDYLQTKANQKKEIRLNFICTHNSRRSHLAQVWAQAIAKNFQMENVICYSGGTQASAVFPMVIETLQNAGFEIQTLSESTNPVYSIKYSENALPILGFSKTFDNAFNPKSRFAAIMTCSQADSGCPFIAGAEKRIPITFEDPKAFDNTTEEAKMYQKRSLQIAVELLYVFSHLKL